MKIETTRETVSDGVGLLHVAHVRALVGRQVVVMDLRKRVGQPSVVKFTGDIKITVQSPRTDGVEGWRTQEANIFPCVANTRMLFESVQNRLEELGCEPWLAEHLQYLGRNELTSAGLEHVMEQQAQDATEEEQQGD